MDLSKGNKLTILLSVSLNANEEERGRSRWRVGVWPWAACGHGTGGAAIPSARFTANAISSHWGTMGRLGEPILMLENLIKGHFHAMGPLIVDAVFLWSWAAWMWICALRLRAFTVICTVKSWYEITTPYFIPPVKGGGLYVPGKFPVPATFWSGIVIYLEHYRSA